MSAFFWGALAFFLVAGAVGTGFVGLRVWSGWQAFVSFAAAGAARAERLAAATERLAARSDETSRRLDELNVALERISRTEARARILLGAWGEVTSLLRAANILTPRR